MSGDEVLVCESLTKAYSKSGEGVVAVGDLDLRLCRGESLVVIGPNGAGKSTLLRLIAGITDPTAGRIQRVRRTTGLIELGVGFEPDLTGRENLAISMALGGYRARSRRRLEPEIIEFSGIGSAIDRPVKHYSLGMVARLGLASALHSEPELLLVDEVLSVGDTAFQRKSLARMRALVADGCALVLITHQMALARRVADSALWLEAGREVRRGPAFDVVSEYERHYTYSSRLEEQDHTQITSVVLEPDHIRPGGSSTLRAQLVTRRRQVPLSVRVELRPPVGDDDRWMLSRREPSRNLELNIIGRTETHHIRSVDSDTAEFVIELPQIPITSALIDVVLVVLDESGSLLDELGVAMRIGEIGVGSEMPKLLVDVTGPTEGDVSE